MFIDIILYRQTIIILNTRVCAQPDLCANINCKSVLLRACNSYDLATIVCTQGQLSTEEG